MHVRSISFIYIFFKSHPQVDRLKGRNMQLIDDQRNRNLKIIVVLDGNFCWLMLLILIALTICLLREEY